MKDIKGNNLNKDPIFILGVERCGSTWLSNIFDSSSDVIFYMEPFAEFAKIFSGFPDRLFYISNNQPFYQEILQLGYKKLYQYKYPFWDKHNANFMKRWCSSYLVKAHDKFAKLIYARNNLKSVRYHLLNLHNIKENNLPNKKSSNPTNIVVKELRLNFKIGILKDVFPNAKYIVLLRNPLAQINSIFNLLSKGSLYQLKESLYSIVEYAKTASRFEKYHNSFNSIKNDSILDRLTTYWFLNYNTLIEDLSHYNCNFQTIRHEDLCVDTEQITKELFNFTGLNFGPITEDYIKRSSTSVNQSVSSPLDTNRNSKVFFLEVLKKIDTDFKEQFLHSSKEFWNLSPSIVKEYEQSILENK